MFVSKARAKLVLLMKTAWPFSVNMRRRLPAKKKQPRQRLFFA